MDMEKLSELSSSGFWAAGISSGWTEPSIPAVCCGELPDGMQINLKSARLGRRCFSDLPITRPAHDPVVRVQAGEVRRRLEQFYQHEGLESEIRIELPVGSYCPEFHPASESLKLLVPTAPGANETAKTHPPQKIKSAFLWGISAVGMITLIAVILMSRDGREVNIPRCKRSGGLFSIRPSPP